MFAIVIAFQHYHQLHPAPCLWHGASSSIAAKLFAPQSGPARISIQETAEFLLLALHM